jgi:hypothetical protein
MVPVRVSVTPASATLRLDDIVQQDHEVLELDDGGAHVMAVSAPGYLTRRLDLTVKGGMQLDVKLPHAPVKVGALEGPWLAPPAAAPLDPVAAFAELGRVLECLEPAAAAQAQEGKRFKPARDLAQDATRCLESLDKAAPEIETVDAAGQAYLRALRAASAGGDKRLAELAGADGAVRAAVAAARAALERDELLRHEREVGKNGLWHVLTWSMAAQARLRGAPAEPEEAAHAALAAWHEQLPDAARAFVAARRCHEAYAGTKADALRECNAFVEELARTVLD